MASKADLMLVPHRRGKLHLASGREMMAYTLPRDAIRAAVHAGVHISDEPAQDLAAARRAAGNAFRNRADQRRLMLVVAEPYAAAAGKIADALADAVQVTAWRSCRPPIPAAEASSRIAAGQPVDGILTDDADTAGRHRAARFPGGVPSVSLIARAVPAPAVRPVSRPGLIQRCGGIELPARNLRSH